MDSTIANIPFTEVFLDIILISSEGSFKEHKEIVKKTFLLLSTKIILR